MEFKEFSILINSLKIGKQLPTSIYLHQDAFQEIPTKLLTFINETCGKLNIVNNDWNLIKLFKRDFKFTLLHYPDFFTDSYPSLSTSYTIDLIKGNVRKASYVDSNNPPILHRKETFLLSDHPKVEEFKLITKEGENLGL